MPRWTSLLLLAALPACSTIVEGRSQTLFFSSTPPGAECALTRNNENLGKITTPGNLLIQKTKYDITAVCKKAGFQDATVTLKSGAAAATFGNIIAGGGIGWIVDSATGSDNKYDDPTSVTLVPVSSSSSSAPASTGG